MLNAKIKIRKENDRALRNSGVGATVTTVIAYIIFASYTLLLLFILGWGFLQSLKENREFFRDMLALPQKWLFSNYITAFGKLQYNGVTFAGMLLNSLWFSVGMTLISVFMHCVTGYIFAKYDFKGKAAAFAFILLTLAVPVVGTLPSQYKVITTLRFNESPLFLITSLGGFGSNFLITYAFFKGIDKAYMEAAQIDGANDLYIFLRIMLPLASAPFAALSILGIIMQWNNYETPLLFLTKLPTLASGLYNFREVVKYESNETVYLASAFITMIPIMLLVTVFGNKIMTSMAVGGIKG